MAFGKVCGISFRDGYRHLMTVCPGNNGRSVDLESWDHLSPSFKEFILALYGTKIYPVHVQHCALISAQSFQVLQNVNPKGST